MKCDFDHSDIILELVKKTLKEVLLIREVNKITVTTEKQEYLKIAMK